MLFVLFMFMTHITNFADFIFLVLYGTTVRYMYKN